MSFPKNLAILNMNPPASTPHNPVLSTSLLSNSVISTAENPKSAGGSGSKQDASEGPVAKCPTHGKKIEAFCDNEKQLLCIDCILSESHKQREMCSIFKAVEQEKEQLEESEAKCVQN